VIQRIDEDNPSHTGTFVLIQGRIKMAYAYCCLWIKISLSGAEKAMGSEPKAKAFEVD
jgi:hypothetical protein